MAPPVAAQDSILLIDDDEILREVLSALLEPEGIHVTAVAAGVDALSILKNRREEPFRAVLTDLHLPGEETIALLRQLRASVGPKTLLLGMSGSEAQPSERQLLDGFLLKPFGAADVQRAMNNPRSSPQTSVSDMSEVVDAPVLDQVVYKQLAAALKPPALRELYELTLHDVEKRIGVIRDAAHAGDEATCRAEAHALKGGCGMVGAMELRALAFDIEAGASVDTPRLQKISAAAQRLRRMLDALP